MTADELRLILKLSEDQWAELYEVHDLLDIFEVPMLEYQRWNYPRTYHCSHWLIHFTFEH